ncbi:MAG: hypothetical protein GY757_33490 [bacterium]|nr:hypothetical protein [bacterium]
MHELKLVSESTHLIRPLVEAALANELRLIEAGVRQTESHLNKFEEKYQLKTQDFICDYENDKLDETLDFIEWIGESRLLKRLNQKADTLRSIKFAH